MWGGRLEIELPWKEEGGGEAEKKLPDIHIEKSQKVPVRVESWQDLAQSNFPRPAYESAPSP